MQELPMRNPIFAAKCLEMANVWKSIHSPKKKPKKKKEERSLLLCAL